MGRIYRVPANFTLTNAGGNADLVNISPADDKPCRLAGWSLGQNTEEGDVMAETLRITMRKLTGTITDGSGGSSVTLLTPPGLAAPGFAARVNDSTVATQTGGADDVIEEHGWNVQAAPWVHFIPEELRDGLLVRQGERLIMRSEDTVADDIGIQGTWYVEEM